ncbi:unnamed protein product [Acanthosepion pharaonis]|uniref:Uncharacterized protein n=1 Tax=Acanthosepion pharaonis TaxID=158019 RepID=A0A812DPH8_ACAPH|nr:unnamed protein product [Sepia pharaonis]
MHTPIIYLSIYLSIYIRPLKKQTGAGKKPCSSICLIFVIPTILTYCDTTLLNKLDIMEVSVDNENTFTHLTTHSYVYLSASLKLYSSFSPFHKLSLILTHISVRLSIYLSIYLSISICVAAFRQGTICTYTPSLIPCLSVYFNLFITLSLC